MGLAGATFSGVEARMRVLLCPSEWEVISDPAHAKWWYFFLGAAYGANGQVDQSGAAWSKAGELPEPPEDCPQGG